MTKFLLLTSFLISSCLVTAAFTNQKRDVEVYRVAKEIVEPVQIAQTEAPAGEMGIVWETPEGWQQDEVPGMMQLVSFTIPATEGKAEGAKASIVILGGDAGGLIPNVNRWRGQVGLQPQEEAEILASVVSIEGKSGPMRSFEIVGDTQATTVALIENADHTIFVKVIGDKDTVLANKEQFTSFAASIQDGSKTE